MNTCLEIILTPQRRGIFVPVPTEKLWGKNSAIDSSGALPWAPKQRVIDDVWKVANTTEKLCVKHDFHYFHFKPQR